VIEDNPFALLQLRLFAGSFTPGEPHSLDECDMEACLATYHNPCAMPRDKINPRPKEAPYRGQKDCDPLICFESPYREKEATGVYYSISRAQQADRGGCLDMRVVREGVFRTVVSLAFS